MQAPIRILHVEDDDDDSQLMERAVRLAGHDAHWTRVETEQPFREALEAPPDIVLADYLLPGFGGLRALGIAKARHPDLPFILVSGTIGEERAVEARRLGADDYVWKDRLGRLPAAILNAVRSARDRAARREAQEKLAEREAGLRHAQTMAKLAYVVTGAGGTFESWSDTFAVLAGAATMPRSLRGWLALVHPDDREGFRAISVAAAKSPGRAEVEYRLLRPGGEIAHVRQTLEPLAPGEGARRGVRWFNTLQDITESKIAEERVRRLNRVHAVLSGINAAMLRIREEPALLREACRVAVEAGHFAIAWIGLVDREDATVRPVASFGEGASALLESAPAAALSLRDGERGMAERAVRGKLAAVSNNVNEDSHPLVKDQLQRLGIRSLSILPLLAGAESIGVLALYATEIGFFDEDEMRLLTELAGDVSYALQQIEKARRLDHLSYFDPLTDLANRRLFHEKLKLQLDNAARTGERVGLQIVDVVRFKAVTDSLGRQAGDALLVEIARRMQKGAWQQTWFARLEADHFAIIMPGVGGAEEIARRSEVRYREVFGAPFELGGASLHVDARRGIALFPDDAQDADGLLRSAEAALKRSKVTGERYLFHAPEMTARSAEGLALENRLRRALENGDFVLHYQPQYRADGQSIAGLEALVRWQSPELGLVPPLDFLPMLEATGLIVPLGAWALRRAALDRRSWLESGLEAPNVSVNVSALQLGQRDFVETVERALADGASPHGIDLEITETLIMQDIQSCIGKLNAVRSLGVGIAIDDFGTGYSSLLYLARLPVQALKIDRSFISLVNDDPAMTTLVQTMIALGHSLNLRVIAEGVETEAQARFLRLLQCDEMQGYLFSKPRDKDDIAGLLQERR